MCREATNTIIPAFITNQIEYHNSSMNWLPKSLIKKFQYVQERLPEYFFRKWRSRETVMTSSQIATGSGNSAILLLLVKRYPLLLLWNTTHPVSGTWADITKRQGNDTIATPHIFLRLHSCTHEAWTDRLTFCRYIFSWMMVILIRSRIWCKNWRFVSSWSIPSCSEWYLLPQNVEYVS